MRNAIPICMLLWSMLAWCPAAPAQSPAFGGAEANLRAWLLRHKSAAKADRQVLDGILQRLEVVRLDGGHRSAAVRFAAILLDPAFRDLSGTPAFHSMRYQLAAALARQGAYGKARELLLGLMAEKPDSPLKAPSWRKLADISLRSGQLDESLGALSRLGTLQEEDARSEVAYMKGKALALLGHADAALASLKGIARNSRRFAQARYLSGLLHLEAGHKEEAEDAFCTLVQQPGQGRYTFYFNDRTEQVVQESWMALARLRHDGGDYFRALQTYDRVDPKGPSGVRAAYESSWTLFRLGEMRRVRRKLQSLLDDEDLGPALPSAELLFAYAKLGDCLFEGAKASLDLLDARLDGVAESTEELLAAGLQEGWTLPRRAQAWAPPLRRERRIQQLRRDIAEAQGRIRRLRADLLRISRPEADDMMVEAAVSLEYSLLSDLARARALRLRIAEARMALGKADGEQNRRKQLLVMLKQVDEAATRARAALDRLRAASLDLPPPTPSAELPVAYLKAEAESSRKLLEALASQAERAQKLFLQSLRQRSARLARQVKAWSRQSALARIDLVMGQKQALEVEIQNLALGRYPLSLLRELIEAGQLDDDLEYWPYEGEEWPDEFE